MKSGQSKLRRLELKCELKILLESPRENLKPPCCDVRVLFCAFPKVEMLRTEFCISISSKLVCSKAFYASSSFTYFGLNSLCVCSFLFILTTNHDIMYSKRICDFSQHKVLSNCIAKKRGNLLKSCYQNIE